MPTAPPETGTLAEVSPVRLYCLAAGGDQTGLLRLQLPDRLIQLQFRKGNLEHVSSSHPEESLPAYLKGEKLISGQQLAEAEKSASESGDMMGTLFRLGVLNPANALVHLSGQVMWLLAKVLLAANGTFGFEQGALPHKVMPLGNRWMVLAESLRRIAASEFARRLADQMDLLVVKREGTVPINVLPLTAQEARAASRLDGTRSLARLGGEFPQESDHLIRLGFLFRELGGISFQAAPAPRPTVKAEPPTTSRSSPPAVRAQPAPGNPPSRLQRPAAKSPSINPPAAAPQPEPPATVSPEKELADLRAKGSRLKDENYFQILGLADNADASAVKVAYIKMAKVYHPDTVSMGNSSPQIAKLKEEIFTAVGEAYRVLSDPKSRLNYEEILRSGANEEELLPLAQVLVAEEKFQRGCNLIKAKRFPEAVKMLDEAIGGHPDEGEFYAWRGYAKFFIVQDKRQALQEAQGDLQVALQKNKHCAAAYYLLGQVAKLSGDKKNALNHFRKAVELKPDHIDAKREVRILSGNK
jgi:curved DNA-binding protein CbpA